MDKTTIAHLLSMDRWEVVDVMDNWLSIVTGKQIGRAHV